jgi:hypothetical protein
MAIFLPPLGLHDMLQGEIYLLVDLTNNFKNVKTNKYKPKDSKGGIIIQNRNISVVTCSSLQMV